MVHPYLARVFICISFAYNTQKLVHLQKVLDNFVNFQTATEIVIITTRAEALLNTLSHLGYGSGVAVYKDDKQFDTDNPYSMLWEHRKLFAEVFSRNFTAYIYVEDDTYLTWEAVQSWACDTQILSPLGFTRGFYRTEIHPSHGNPVMLDANHAVPLATYDLTVNFNEADVAQIKSTCTSHRNFLQMPQPYHGMWMATHEQLQDFMGADVYSKEGALKKDLPFGHYGGYPERTNWWFWLYKIPYYQGKTFTANCLVPYDPLTKRLDEEARVPHLRNGYAGVTVRLAHIKEDEYLLP